MKYAHVVNAVLDSPWAILPSRLALMMEVLAARIAEVEIDIEAGPLEARKPGKNEGQAGETALIPVLGTLVPRGSMDADSGMTSTALVQKKLERALEDSSVSSIVLDIDSPGGSVYGIPELGKAIRRGRAQKPIFASITGVGASAAYYLASQASRVSMSPSSEVGSIGVMLAHRDLSKALEQKGVKMTLISAGEFKTEANPFEPLTEEATAELQAAVDYYYDLFLTDVARGRSKGKKVVKEEFGKGRLVRADEALRAGMVDAIETLDDTVSQAILTTAVKGKAAEIATIREFERFLRDAGFSRGRAKEIAATGFGDQRDAEPGDQRDAELDTELVDTWFRKYFGI